MLTPAMQQFYDLKKQNPDSILWFRMGDFYEMFGEDALTAHKVLGINVTTRNKNATNPEPLAGIPYHAKDKYLPILVNAGYKVAIAEQVSDPKLKGILKREVVRIITPSTLALESENYKTDEVENYILSIYEEKGKFGISFLELNSFLWKTGEFDSFDKLSKEIYKISPKEVILDKKLFGDEKVKEMFSRNPSLNIYYFESILNPYKKLLNHFGVKNLEGFALEGKSLAQKTSSTLLEYLESNQKESLSNLDKISFETFTDFLDLDESTIKNLDLVYNFAISSKKGTLFSILDKTNTSMGKRLLRESIVRPLQDEHSINKRLDMIEELLKNTILLDKINSKLKLVSDLDNILTRLSLGRALPRDLLNLKNSLKVILEVFEIIEAEGSEKLNEIIGK